MKSLLASGPTLTGARKYLANKAEQEEIEKECYTLVNQYPILSPRMKLETKAMTADNSSHQEGVILTKTTDVIWIEVSNLEPVSRPAKQKGLHCPCSHVLNHEIIDICALQECEVKQNIDEKTYLSRIINSKLKKMI